jgi:glycosyltransferase involved in cell wall biosynthesis
MTTFPEIVMPSSQNHLSICIVSHNAYRAISGGESGAIGGVEWQTSLTARWLAARGHRVTMLTWDEGGPSEECFDGVRVMKICRQTAGLPGLRFFYPKWTRLVNAMRRADADVYYHNCGECFTGQIALWCRRNRKAFVFSSANDTDCDPALPDLKSVGERVLYRYGLRHAHARVVQTETQRLRLRAEFGLDAVRIPMPCSGASEEDFAQRQHPGSGRVLWIARLTRQKRPDRFLDLVQASPELQFDFVGPAVNEPYSQAVCKRATTLSNVTVHGALPRPRVADLYRRASLLCCTSDYEGFPNTFLEAWSHGLPIVSTFDPDGLIAKRRLGVIAKDSLEMKEAIHSLLRSPATYREMSHNARRYYWENHRVETILPQFERLFQGAAQAVGRRQLRAKERACPSVIPGVPNQ